MMPCRVCAPVTPTPKALNSCCIYEMPKQRRHTNPKREHTNPKREHTNPKREHTNPKRERGTERPQLVSSLALRVSMTKLLAWNVQLQAACLRRVTANKLAACGHGGR